MATNLSAQISALATQIGTDIKSILGSIGTLSDLTTTQKANLVASINELKATIDRVAGSVGATINDEATNTSQTWSSSKISSAISEAVSALVGGAPDALDTLKELADAISTNGDAIEALQAIAAGHVKYDAAQSLSTEQQQQARTNIGAAAASDLTTLQGTVTTLQGTVSQNTTSIGQNTASIGTLGNLATATKTDLVTAINEVKTTADSAVSAASSAQSTAEAAQQAAETAQSTATNAQSAVTTLSSNVGDTQADFVTIYTSARDGTA